MQSLRSLGHRGRVAQRFGLCCSRSAHFVHSSPSARQELQTRADNARHSSPNRWARNVRKEDFAAALASPNPPARLVAGKRRSDGPHPIGDCPQGSPLGRVRTFDCDGPGPLAFRERYSDCVEPSSQGSMTHSAKALFEILPAKLNEYIQMLSRRSRHAQHLELEADFVEGIFQRAVEALFLVGREVSFAWHVPSVSFLRTNRIPSTHNPLISDRKARAS